MMEVLDGDLEKAVFGFIPNTSETSYLGLLEALFEESQRVSAERIWRLVE